jgi:hypothetical protein
MSPLKKQNLLLKMHLVLLLNFKKKTAPFCVKIIVENSSKATTEIYTQVITQEIGSIIKPLNNF